MGHLELEQVLSFQPDDSLSAKWISKLGRRHVI